MTTRYAIYYVPGPQSALYQFGTRWLTDSRFMADTSIPSHYGFHATLKAPFALDQGYTEAMLDAAMRQFVRTLEPFDMPQLAVERFNETLSLVPVRRCEALEQIAADCVQQFDHFRAPLTEADYLKRPDGMLSPRQRELRQRWGYPYVMDEFRFHMTLTNPLTGTGKAPQLLTELKNRFRDLQQQTDTFYGLCLYRQPNRQEPFSAYRRYSVELATEAVS